jgi:hypothetical protein
MPRLTAITAPTPPPATGAARPPQARRICHRSWRKPNSDDVDGHLAAKCLYRPFKQTAAGWTFGDLQAANLGASRLFTPIP